MRISTILTLAISVQAAYAYLKLDYKKERRELNVFANKRRQLTKRNKFQLNLDNFEIFCSTTLQIGSNGDEVVALVDTGSSDLWVMGGNVECFFSVNKRDTEEAFGANEIVVREDSDLPESTSDAGTFPTRSSTSRTASRRTTATSETSTASPTLSRTASRTARTASRTSRTSRTRSIYSATLCTQEGTFSTAGSDSFQLNETAPAFTLEYDGGSEVTGVYGVDQVKLQNITIRQLSFAVVERSSFAISILGIGLTDSQSTNVYNESKNPYTYENLPQRLKSEGIIKRNMYSIFLSQPEAEAGTILFGAVDKAKFEGELLVKPLVFTDEVNRNEPTRFAIELSEIEIINGSETTSVSRPSKGAILATGESYSNFPNFYIDQLAEQIPSAIYDDRLEMYEIDCEESGYNVLFGFNGTSIEVPFEEMIVRNYTKSGGCYLGVFPSAGPYFVLGDIFLKYAYVAFDLEAKAIGIAPVRNTTEEDIEIAIDGIPKSREYDETNDDEENNSDENTNSDDENTNGEEDETTAGDNTNALVPSTLWVSVFVVSILIVA